LVNAAKDNHWNTLRDNLKADTYQQRVKSAYPSCIRNVTKNFNCDLCLDF